MKYVTFAALSATLFASACSTTGSFVDPGNYRVRVNGVDLSEKATDKAEYGFEGETKARNNNTWLWIAGGAALVALALVLDEAGEKGAEAAQDQNMAQ